MNESNENDPLRVAEPEETFPARLRAHTPGPWHVEEHLGRYEIWTKDRGQQRSFVGVVHTSDDARLIAAVPELVEALKRLVSDHEQGLSFDISWSIARAAIAKATGGDR